MVWANVALVHVLGTSSWREIPQLPHESCMGDFFKEEGCICAHGDVHWFFHIGLRKKIMRSFDFTKEEFYSTPLPPTSSAARNSYITLNGCLALISVNVNPERMRNDDPTCESIDLWVMKDYKSKKWTLEYHLNLPEEIRSEYKLRCYGFHCGEWDHGIYFVSESNEFIFFDLRNTDPEAQAEYVKIQGKRLEFPWHENRAFSLRRSFISLKQFQHSAQDPNVDGSLSLTLLDFSKKYLWDQEVKPVWPIPFEVERIQR